MRELSITYGTDTRHVSVVPVKETGLGGEPQWIVHVPVLDFAKEIRAGERVYLETSDNDVVVSEGMSYRGGLEPAFGDDPIERGVDAICSYFLTRKEGTPA